jgi:DNA repair exonuclease SbcCD ATPase subunit
MKTSSISFRAKRSPWAIAAATVVALFLSAGLAQAEYGLGSVLGNGGNKFSNAPAADNTAGNTTATPNSPTAAPGSPVEEFSKQLEDFQKSVPDLNKKIQDGAGAIDSASDIDKAKAEIDSLRDEVSTLLGAVSDNGPVSQLGAKALNHIHDKIRTLSQENRFKPEERQYLIDQWQRLQAQTETATKELDDARAQFAGLLQTLQSNEDFIGELVEIRQAEKALDVIRSLTHDIRDASTQLNRLIGNIRPPGA